MYYQIPMNLGALMEGKDVVTCSLPDNIAQHLQILLTSRPGENRFDSRYGNGIWNIEFENGISSGQWDEMCKQAIAECIRYNEKRIVNPDIKIYSTIVEKTWPLKKYNEIKRKVTIIIEATIVENNEKFSFKTNLFLSPMSVD